MRSFLLKTPVLALFGLRILFQRYLFECSLINVFLEEEVIIRLLEIVHVTNMGYQKLYGIHSQKRYVLEKTRIDAIAYEQVDTNK